MNEEQLHWRPIQHHQPAYQVNFQLLMKKTREEILLILYQLEKGLDLEKISHDLSIMNYNSW